MVASKIQNPAGVAAEFRILSLGIEEVIVAIKIQMLAAAAAEFLILNFGIKEVMVVKT